MKFIKYRWEIFVAIILLYLLGTIALGYAAYQTPPPTSSSVFIEVTKTVFLCLGALGVILPTYINATNSLEARISDKIENTFRLIEKWDNSHLFEARKFTRDVKANRSKISDEDLIKDIESNEDLKQSVILVFNYFEQVRFSIVSNRIDKEQLKGTLGIVIVIVDIIDRFKPFTDKIGGIQMTKDLDQLKASLK